MRLTKEKEGGYLLDLQKSLKSKGYCQNEFLRLHHTLGKEEKNYMKNHDKIRKKSNQL